MVNTISHQVTAWMVEGCEDKKNGFRVVLKHTGYFSYFVTQNARHAFAAVVVSLVIRCMLYYYMYHVVLHLSQFEENKLWVPSLLIRVSHYLWRTPQVLFHTVRVGCFLLWWRSWSYSRNQPPIKRSKPNWWSQQSLLRKAFSVVDVFENVLMEIWSTSKLPWSIIAPSQMKKTVLHSQGRFNCGNRSVWGKGLK